MTLSDIIEGRSKLQPEDEVKAWAADRHRAEAVYLATIRLCDERCWAASQRMHVKQPDPEQYDPARPGLGSTTQRMEG